MSGIRSLSTGLASGLRNDQKENGLWLAAIVLIHGVVLAALVMGLGTPLPVSQPTIMGVLVSDSKGEAKAAMAEKREPARNEVHQSKHAPPVRPLPKTVANAPASERAPSAAPAAPAPSLAAASTPSSGGMSGAKNTSDQVTSPRSDAAHLSNPKPDYPSMSRRMGEQGRVLLSVYILADGTVGEIRIRQTSGYDRLDQAAMDAVRRWHYVPARRGNEPIPYWYVQPIVFSLKT